MAATAAAVRLRPLGDRVLVKPLEKKEEVRGGLIIPDTAKEKPQEGEIIAAGKGKVGEDGKLIPMDVKPGDKILYGKYSGSEIKIEGQEYLIMHQEDILGIVE
jgi:chaperonin GroES